MKKIINNNKAWFTLNHIVLITTILVIPAMWLYISLQNKQDNEFCVNNWVNYVKAMQLNSMFKNDIKDYLFNSSNSRIIEYQYKKWKNFDNKTANQFYDRSEGYCIVNFWGNIMSIKYKELKNFVSNNSEEEISLMIKEAYSKLDRFKNNMLSTPKEDRIYLMWLSNNELEIIQNENQ